MVISLKIQLHSHNFPHILFYLSLSFFFSFIHPIRLLDVFFGTGCNLSCLLFIMLYILYIFASNIKYDVNRFLLWQICLALVKFSIFGYFFFCRSLNLFLVGGFDYLSCGINFVYNFTTTFCLPHLWW